LLEQGTLKKGQALQLAVNKTDRRSTERNHTATHLLHAALRTVLGDGVRQAGSLVHPDHLRFDFTHGQPLAAEQRAEVARLVNGWILDAIPTEIVADRPIEEARAAGAVALFGEKYGERVRTVGIPGVSLELCGGCHVRNTGEIGPFVVRTERGVASGVRRIEAITGEAALAFLSSRDDELRQVEDGLGAEAGGAVREVEALRDRLKQRESELARLRVELVSGSTTRAEELEVAGIKLVVREVPAAPAGELRDQADLLRGRLGSGIVVLGARSDGKVSLVAAVSDDLRSVVPAGRLLKRVAAMVGGSGGGRDDFAQAGGKLPEKLAEALEQVPALVEELAGNR
jgi:alanyl-tRNA synthetase